MSDLTSELQRVADDAASRARPIAAKAVIQEGDRRRRRAIAGRYAGGLSAAGVVAAAALTVTTLVPSGSPHGRPAGLPAGHQPAAALAAWTVVKQADGTVSVTIREFRDPAGLQARLRADGVPASAIFYPGELPRGVPFSRLFDVPGNPCQPFSGGQGRLLKVVRGPRPKPLTENSTISVIYPSSLPSGAGVQFISTTNVGYQNTTDQRHALGVWLVQASPGCTGS
ncbi:MAG: hypothetical protein ACRDPY_07705 [Streptosporangiaceae bacterium]